jgi:hypothetical protein
MISFKKQSGRVPRSRTKVMRNDAMHCEAAKIFQKLPSRDADSVQRAACAAAVRFRTFFAVTCFISSFLSMK